jgi:signal transduction histidine kinase
VSVLVTESICSAAFTGAALLHEWRVRVHALDTTVRGRSDSLLGAIQDAEDPNDNILVDPTELDIPKADVYAVYSQNGQLLGVSAAAPANLIARTSDGVFTRRAGGETYRVLQRQGVRVIDRIENGGVGLRRNVTILYAVRSGRVWHEVLEGIGFYLGLGIFLILLTAAAIIILLRRILAPINELAQEAGKLSLRSFTFEAPASALAVRELRPLAETLSATVSSLRRSFEQQSRFVGDAAHELKTAVAVVRSSVQLLLLRPREPVEYLAGLNTVLLDNTRVEDLVARMLVSARFEEQASIGNRNSCEIADLSAAVRRVIERLRPYTEAQQIQPQVYIPATAEVCLRAEEADVLLSNLIVNAVQHSDPDQEISISVAQGQDFVVLQVEDQGEGISPTALPHIFERFFREDTARSRKTGGAGLGLAICKSIVDAANGEITIESKPAVETIVTVRLPLGKDLQARLTSKGDNAPSGKLAIPEEST